MATQINDAKLTAVRTLSGLSTADINTAWRTYLLTLTGLTSGTINDLEFYWLGTLGYTGSLNDRWAQYLRAAGYTGSISDMMLALWIAGGPQLGTALSNMDYSYIGLPFADITLASDTMTMDYSYLGLPHVTNGRA